MTQPLKIPISDTMIDILKRLRASGHVAWVVGGAVRDALLGNPSKDVDVEVYGIALDPLGAILSEFGRIDQVGKSFGVIKLRDSDGSDYDFAIPRRDSKVGPGHRDFTVTFDPTITPAEAAARRDFTINAIAYDPLSDTLHDFHDGVRDLRDRILRATSGAFAEDPLRVLRGLQFAARFRLSLDPETAVLCRSMATDYATLAQERVWGEWEKLLTKGRDFTGLFDYLHQTGWGGFYPEVMALAGVPQEPEWHPEGDCDRHTALVMNAAVEIADREGLVDFRRLMLITSALCHDFGKPSTTLQREKDGKMRWTSYRHEEAGVPIATEFLRRIGAPRELIAYVRPLVERHLEHIQYKLKPSKGKIRLFAHRIIPATVEDMALLIEADASGRAPAPKGLPETAARMLEYARRENVHNKMPPRIIEGRDVMPYYNNKPGPHVGVDVTAAYDAWLDGKYSTPEEAYAWLDIYMQRRASILKGSHVLPYFGGVGDKRIADVLSQAWQQQRSGRITDEESALSWLAEYMKETQADEPNPGTD